MSSYFNMIESFRFQVTFLIIFVLKRDLVSRTALVHKAVYAAETESEEEAFQAIRDFKSLKKKVLCLGQLFEPGMDFCLESNTTCTCEGTSMNIDDSFCFIYLANVSVFVQENYHMIKTEK